MEIRWKIHCEVLWPHMIGLGIPIAEEVEEKE